MFSDWNLIKRNELILHDLENFPLEILSNSEIGGNEFIRVTLFDANKARISHMYFDFREISHNFVYWEIMCKDAATRIYKSDLPDTPNKVWKVTKTESFIRLQCNGQNVAEVNFDESSSTLSDTCKDLAKQDVHYIRIRNDDTASDFVKQQGWLILEIIQFSLL